MFISRFADPAVSASRIHSFDSSSPSLPDRLDRSFRFSLLPLNHDPVTIKAAPRKPLGSAQDVPEAAVLAILSDLTSGRYLIQPRVDAEGWTFTCALPTQHSRPCLTLRTDRLHNLEWIEKETDEEAKWRVEFTKPASLPSPSTLKQSKRCPPYLYEAYFSASSEEQMGSFQKEQKKKQEKELDELFADPLLEDHLQESRNALAAYAYLCDSLGAPITGEDYSQALLKAQHFLMEAHSGEFKMEIANIKGNGNENESELSIKLLAQRDVARSMACIWFGGAFDEWKAEEVTDEVAAEIRACMPSGLIEKLIRHQPGIKKAKNAALQIADMVCGWIGGAAACEEICGTISHLYSSCLEEDEEVRKLEKGKKGYVHGYVEYRRKSVSIRIDGWIGSGNNKTVALTKHAYELSRSGKETTDFFYRKKMNPEELAQDIQELFARLRSSAVFMEYFQSLLEKKREGYHAFVSQGGIAGMSDFMPLPILSNSFREDAREVLKLLKERNAIGFELKALHRAARQTGLQAKPSTFSAVAGASKKLMAKVSKDYAEEFARHVASLEKIDASNAHETINEWLASSRFKSWEVFDDLAQGKADSLLERLAKAFENMDEDQIQPALEQFRRQLPFLLARHDAFSPKIIDMADRAFLRLKPQSGRRAEDIISSKQLRWVLEGLSENFEQLKQAQTAIHGGATAALENADLMRKIGRLLEIAKESGGG